MNSGNETKVDGRAERTAATRQKILAVTRQLILAGSIEPTAREIAAQAHITTRTLFRHFADMESLHRSLIADAEGKAAAVMDEPFSAQANSGWQEQIQQVIDRRVRVYESLLPLYISTIWSRYRASTSDSGQRGGITRRRKRLMDVLPDEITRDRTLFEAVDGVLGIEYWVSLRRDQRLSVSKAASVLSLAVEKLLGCE
jgi:AcrR family transcriptional regulator